MYSGKYDTAAAAHMECYMAAILLSPASALSCYY